MHSLFKEELRGIWAGELENIAGLLRRQFRQQYLDRADQVFVEMLENGDLQDHPMLMASVHRHMLLAAEAGQSWETALAEYVIGSYVPSCLPGFPLECPSTQPEDRFWLAAGLDQVALSIRALPPPTISMAPVGPVASSNDPRDKWLYEQCCKGVKYSTIETRLAQRAAKKSWEPLKTNGIKAAANRYAKRHGLSPIPARQMGRPRARKTARAK